MFINVAYKDPAELSYQPWNLHTSNALSKEEESEEKLLLVNPDCPVRIMLEYIRNKCKLAEKTTFDLCDATGNVKGLFNMPTYAYATHLFETRCTYYLFVTWTDKNGATIVLPQVLHSNPMYLPLQLNAKKTLMGDVISSSGTAGKNSKGSSSGKSAGSVSKTSGGKTSGGKKK